MYFPFEELQDVAIQFRVVASCAVTQTFPSADWLPLTMVPEIIGAAVRETSSRSMSVASDRGATFVNPLTTILLSSI